jgi:hypothetical protein
MLGTEVVERRRRRDQLLHRSGNEQAIGVLLGEHLLATDREQAREPGGLGAANRRRESAGEQKAGDGEQGAGEHRTRRPERATEAASDAPMASDTTPEPDRLAHGNHVDQRNRPMAAAALPADGGTPSGTNSCALALLTFELEQKLGVT